MPRKYAGELEGGKKPSKLYGSAGYRNLSPFSQLHGGVGTWMQPMGLWHDSPGEGMLK